MAVPRKIRRIVRSNSSDTDDSNNENQNEEMETVEVDFQCKIPEPSDRCGIKNLLQQLFLKAHINTTELADLLIEQSDVTGVIKEATESDDIEIDEDMDVNFAVFSIVNLTEKKNLECVKQICSYLLNHCKEVSSKDKYEQFQSILEDASKHVGLIISERFINIPANISVPLYFGLSNDMKKEAYNFAYYLIISKMVNFTSSSVQENIVYVNPEEELIAEEAEFTFEFQVQAEQDSGLGGKWTDEDDEGIPKRKVLLLPAAKLDSICNKLTAEFGTNISCFTQE